MVRSMMEKSVMVEKIALTVWRLSAEIIGSIEEKNAMVDNAVITASRLNAEMIE